MRLADALGDDEAVLRSDQPPVQEHQGHVLALHLRRGVVRALGLEDAIAGHLEVHAADHSHRVVVVHDQDGAGSHRAVVAEPAARETSRKLADRRRTCDIANGLGVSRHFLAATLGALSVLCAPTLASAGTTTQRDGNDVGGRLDVKWARHAHAGEDLVHTIGTWAPFGSRALSGANIVAFELDTNRNWGDEPEWSAFVYWADGRLQATLVDKAATQFTPLDVRRPATNRLQVKIPLDALDDLRAYRWFAATIDGSSQDFAPNRGGILHDLTPPTIKLTATRVISAAAAAGERFPVTFSVTDRGGSGLAEWRLYWRPTGTTTWSRLRTGTTGGVKTAYVTGVAGEAYDFRVVAWDRQTNRRTSGIRTVLPELTTPFDGTYVAWMSRSGPGWGSGEVVLDRGTPAEQAPEAVVLTAEAETLGVLAFERDGLALGTHTITIRALEGEIAVDAIESR